MRRWASVHGFDYQFLGDELFAELSPELWAKTRKQPVVAADLARLLMLEKLLAEGAERVVWIDADVLVLDAETFALKDADALFGREVWVQRSGSRLKTYRKIHNAFMAFRAGDPVLPFYRFSAERILRAYEPIAAGEASGENEVLREVPTLPPQLIGPKLLTHLHNAIGFDVQENAAMLPPLVSRELLTEPGAACAAFAAESAVAPLAVNLCGSAAASGELDHDDVSRLVARLAAEPERLTTLC
ncbi:MAG: hypothetical protein AAGE43_01830 [Pseudomonadota bacterium]